MCLHFGCCAACSVQFGFVSWLRMSLESSNLFGSRNPTPGTMLHEQVTRESIYVVYTLFKLVATATHYWGLRVIPQEVIGNFVPLNV